MIQIRFGFSIGTSRPETYLCKFSESSEMFGRKDLNLNFYSALHSAVGSFAMAGMINGIVSGPTPFPPLTQNDTGIPYCSEGNLPATCTSTAACFCTHLIKLEYCKTYEFWLIAGGGMNCMR